MIALVGDLEPVKTLYPNSGQTLSVTEHITSPTFYDYENLLLIIISLINLVHMDAYRIEDRN